MAFLYAAKGCLAPATDQNEVPPARDGASDAERSPGLASHPIVGVVEGVFDRVFQPDCESYLPAVPQVATAMVNGLPKLAENEALVMKLRNWFASQPASTVPSKLDPKSVIGNAVDTDHIRGDLLCQLNPQMVQQHILRNINARPIEEETIPIQFFGAARATICELRTIFRKNDISVSIMMGAQTLRELLLGKELLNDPEARRKKIQEIMGRNPDEVARQTAKRAGKRKRQWERNSLQRELKNP